MVFQMDTLKVYKRLATLFDEERAKGLVETFQEVLTPSLLTREDLRAETQAVQQDLHTEIQTVRQDLHAEIELVRRDLRADIQSSQTTMVKWMVGLVLGNVGVTIALFSLLFTRLP